MPPAAKVKLPPVRLGDPWWERDAVARAEMATSSEGLGWYAFYIVSYLSLAILSLVVFPTPCTATPASYLPSVGPPLALLAFRTGSALMVFLVLVRRYFEETEQDEETLDRRKLIVIVHGWWRFCGLTQWQFFLIGLYFTLAIFVQHDAMTTATTASAPSALACVTNTVLGVAFSLAVLTTMCVTFVLVPAKTKMGVSAKHFFGMDELLMHNANSFLLVCDMLLSKQTIQLSDLPYTVILMCVYGAFHHFVRYPLSHTLLYFFISWKMPRAPLVLLALCTSVGLFFLVGVGVSEVRTTWWGPPLVLVVSVLIMRLREPEVKPVK